MPIFHSYEILSKLLSNIKTLHLREFNVLLFCFLNISILHYSRFECGAGKFTFSFEAKAKIMKHNFLKCIFLNDCAICSFNHFNVELLHEIFLLKIFIINIIVFIDLIFI